MIHCANLIINYALFLLQGGNISFLAISREIINCGKNSNRKTQIKSWPAFLSPAMSNWTKSYQTPLQRYKKNLHFLFTLLAFGNKSAYLKIGPSVCKHHLRTDLND